MDWRAEPSTGIRLVNQRANTARAAASNAVIGKAIYILILEKTIMSSFVSRNTVLWLSKILHSMFCGKPKCIIQKSWSPLGAPPPSITLLKLPFTASSPRGCTWPWLSALHIPGAQAVARKSYLCTNNSAGEGSVWALTLAHVWLLQHILCSLSGLGWRIAIYCSCSGVWGAASVGVLHSPAEH